MQMTLKPCNIRKDRFVPSRTAESIELSWAGLRSELAPSGSITALRCLRKLKKGFFVGLVKRSGHVSNFVLDAPNGRFRHFLRNDREFHLKVERVYCVEAVDWESTLVEG